MTMRHFDSSFGARASDLGPGTININRIAERHQQEITVKMTAYLRQQEITVKMTAYLRYPSAITETDYPPQEEEKI
jgi:hypothetical protein